MSFASHRAPAPTAGLRAPVARLAALPSHASVSASPSSSRLHFRLTSLALALSWSLPAHTQQAEDDTAVPTIVVEASPFKRSSEELVQPVDVLSGEALERRRNGTIGDVLADRPGVSNASFGPGVGRPVIRGQGGPRVQILDNGIGTMDASSISADHAVSVDPQNAEQIEIIKGPATLIYGGGASAGLVNVVDDRLPDAVTPGLRVGGNFSYGSNADEKTRSAKLRYGVGPWQFGTQYSLRSAGDFSVPGFATRQHEESEHDHGDDEHDHGHEEADSFNILDNSSLRTESYGASTAFVGSRGMLGAAVTRFETNYGVPGHAHAHEHEHEEGEQEEEAGHSHEGVRIDLEQTRVDLRGKLYAPMRGFEALEARIGVNDYRHKEIEQSGAIGTQFDVTEVEARVQLSHEPIAAWKGVTGLQLSDRDFEAVGAEAFVPPTKTRGVGLFVVEQRPFGTGHQLELGGRVDRLEHEIDGVSNAPFAQRDQGFTTYSLSAGSAFALGEHLHLRLNAQRAQRAPSTEELYAYGPHLATSSFERGDQSLDPETANNIEITLGRDSGRFTWEGSVYYNRINDYVYLQEIDSGLDADGSGTASSDGVADRVDESGQFDAEGELLLVDHRQRNAEFYGAEIQAGYKLLASGPIRLNLRTFGDVVRGEFARGGDLPRITPARAGIGADARIGALTGDISYQRTVRQERTAALETDTPGYDLLSADLGYVLKLGGAQATFYVRGRNLLDEKIRLSTSFLKDVAPLPGRSIFTGLRIDFTPAI